MKTQSNKKIFENKVQEIAEFLILTSLNSKEFLEIHRSENRWLNLTLELRSLEGDNGLTQMENYEHLRFIEREAAHGLQILDTTHLHDPHGYSGRLSLSINISGLREFLNRQRVITNQEVRPELYSKGQFGYIRFSKFGKPIQLGRLSSQPYRLLELLLTARGYTRPVESLVTDLSKRSKRQGRLPLNIVEGAIKEVQRKVKNKFLFKFSSNKTKLTLTVL